MPFSLLVRVNRMSEKMLREPNTDALRSGQLNSPNRVNITSYVSDKTKNVLRILV